MVAQQRFMAPKIIFSICLVICFILLNSCANTNSGINKQDAVSTVRAPIEGIWTGEFDIGGKGPYDFTAVHIDGKAYAFSQRAKAMCVGTVNLDGENYISKYLLFELDGGPFDWATITGKFKEDNKITSHFVTLNGGDTGALNLAYNQIYDLPSSLTKTHGKWSYTDKEGLITEFFIEEVGTLIGHDSDGCKFLGYLEIINPAYNAYQVKVEIAACDSVDGEYEGVSFMANEQLNMHIANENYGLFFAFGPKIEGE